MSQELIKLNNLQLAGRLISEEVMLGIHASKRFGYGIEFEQYRHYEPGDDPKRIDWKLYARTDKHLVRESSTESNTHLRLILDLSGSMNYEENAINRLAYSKVLLASLAYLGYRQGDIMSLYARQDGRLQTLVPAGKQAFQRILYQLEKAQASGALPSNDLELSALYQKEKELVVIVSDLLQVKDEWVHFIQKLANPHRQVLVFQVLGTQELAFDLKGFFRFKDLETGKEMELQAEAIRAEVRQKAHAYLDSLQENLQIPHVFIHQITLQTPIAQVLIEGLKKLKR